MTNTPTTITDEDVPLRPAQKPQPVAAMSGHFTQRCCEWASRNSFALIVCTAALGIVGAPVVLGATTGWPGDSIKDTTLIGVAGLVGGVFGTLASPIINNKVDDYFYYKISAFLPDIERAKREDRAQNFGILTGAATFVLCVVIGYGAGHKMSKQPENITRQPQHNQQTR